MKKYKLKDHVKYITREEYKTLERANLLDHVANHISAIDCFMHPNVLTLRSAVSVFDNFWCTDIQKAEAILRRSL